MTFAVDRMVIHLLPTNIPEKGRIRESTGASACYITALQCQHTNTPPQAMSPTKTATLNLRIDPAIKEAVRQAALREHRSVANFIETLIRHHCEDVGISIPEQQPLFNGKQDG